MSPPRHDYNVDYQIYTSRGVRVATSSGTRMSLQDVCESLVSVLKTVSEDYEVGTVVLSAVLKRES